MEKNSYPGEGPICMLIRTDGKEIDCSQYVISICTQCEFHKIATAEIVLDDGGIFDDDFKIGNADTFLIGKEIEILAGYAEASECLFKGVIVKQRIELIDSSFKLIVTAKHSAFSMTLSRHFRSFEDQTDSDIIRSICNEYGLQLQIDDTTTQHEKIVQYNCSDWDFINMRAETNGLLLSTTPDGIRAALPDLTTKPVIDIQNGFTIYRILAEMDGRKAFGFHQSQAWNYANQKVDDTSENGSYSTSQGNTDAGTLSSLLGNDSFSVRKLSQQENADEMNVWTQSIRMRDSLSCLQGKVEIIGYAPLMPGDLVNLTNIGQRFDGKALVSSVTQNIQNGSWTSTLELGLDAIPYAETYDNISSPAADGLLPHANGLQIAKVEALEGDPLGEERIYVKLMGSEDTKLWARVATLDAGNERGSSFLPEIGDEVIVGFVNDNPCQAVVLGMMHSSSAPSPYPKSDDNHLKGFVSREKIKFEFDDEKKALHMETPGGNKISLSDDDKGITLTDQNGNSITLNGDGITIESKKALSIKSAQDFNMEGMNVNGKANSQLKWEGTASAELSASGNTVVKGGIVQIN